jgi:hypothetical protein
MDSLTDEQLAKAKVSCYRGIARIPLESLNFQHELVQEKHRDVSHTNIARLVRIFEQNGCLRLQEEHVINAIVRDEDLLIALSQERLEQKEFQNLQWAQDAPLLDLTPVYCLSGLHRVEAARRFLPENDQWWIVRLFSYST